MKVKAIKMGYYNDRRQKPGAVFHLNDANHFSENWMEKVESKPKAKEKPAKKEVVEKKKAKDLEVI